MVHEELLKILVCPENKTPVVLADDALIAKANGAIEARTLKNRAGAIIETRIDGGLVREDKAYMYPIRDDIPIMLIDEAIPLDQLAG
ncbi:MAG TPA: Trm112 family protein [Candidatus Hydrogenedentes bacterium]|nr:Trm112 family protein [Candidatus Hydrogenedentota bacterium]HOV72678.1 Trm112 family protein [Candidatus Hydrogenedentota bacterium]HPC16450.1 Trm112 family protein [Candidatus Hydrogenedentota bacterium]HRT20161.1 Trm112 family protein [Candidatus Hydrogenedentota bacterium]HRT63195.1 Trm112 family protein [Candidatus Hydrogenedentota bacterium]